MKHATVFHLISDIARKKGIRCILIGGFAVNYYKVTRQTADVDFLITKDDFNKISGLLEDVGYKRDIVHDVFTRFGSTNFLMDIDFMFVDKETFDKIAVGGQEVIIAGQKFRVPSLNNLIALKLHSIRYNPKLREYKDLPDIINLIKVNKVNFKNQKFQELCLKYGTEEIYKKMLNSLEN